MAKTIHKLTDLYVKKAVRPGLHADGGGLYLQVSRASAKSWIYKFSFRGRSREMGLGSAVTISLAEARELALQARRLRDQGVDPIDARKAARKSEATESVGFMECAEKYIAGHGQAWRNEKHSAQWSSTLETYAGPVLRGVAINAVTVDHVLQILEPIWASKSETARRVRGRIENVLDWARVRGYRDGENPARWRGHLELLLPPRSRLQSVRHHPAMPFEQLPSFIGLLRKREGMASLALEFAILTAARTGEVLGATHDEINTRAAIWTVPATRMKRGREHKVPLVPRALDIVTTCRGRGGR